MLARLITALLLLQQPAHRTIAIDERLAEDAHIAIGDKLVVSAKPGATSGDTVFVSGIVKRGADPAEIARSEYQVRMHLDQLQKVVGYGDRVDRFAVATRGDSATERALNEINASAFGFQAHRSRDIAVGTSRTFQVVSRFHKAIGVITIVASAIFLLCIMLLKVEERRRDVAALRLMGISRATVVKGIVAEAALLALIGCALGVGVGWISSQFINWYYQGIYRTPLYFSLQCDILGLVEVRSSPSCVERLRFERVHPGCRRPLTLPPRARIAPRSCV